MQLIYNLVIETLILIAVVTTLDGVDFEQGVFSMIVAGVFLGLLMYVIDPVLGFFRFPRNFWSYLIVGGVMCVIYFLVLNTLLLGVIRFGVGTIGGDFGPVTLPVLNLETETYTIIFTGLYTLLFSLFVNQLSKYK